MDAAEKQQELVEQGVKYAISGYVDMHGALKGKIVPIAHFQRMAKGSELYTGAALDGLPQEVNEEEVSSHPDIEGGFILPWRRDTAFFPSNLYCHGVPFEACSRNVLNRQTSAAADAGYVFNLGIETEFYVLDRVDGNPVPQTVSERDRLSKPCYDVRTAVDNFEWLTELVDAMNELGWDVYSFDHEDAQGQFEIDWMYNDCTTISDRMCFFRWMAGEIARKHGHFASFMPKPFADRTGSGAHMNMSLASIDTGANLFKPANEADDPKGVGLSELGCHFVAGILKHAKAICAVIAPTVNSYKRLVRQGSMSGSTWAPIFISYGNNNRTNMLRVPLAGGRVECRAADISMNPYLASAMMLAAGMEGIAEGLDAGAPHTENLHKYTAADIERSGIQLLPRNLDDAIEAFEADPLSRRVFGDSLFEEWVSMKKQECDAYRFHITDWERDRYLTFF
jgi:glutamine synthetase